MIHWIVLNVLPTSLRSAISVVTGALVTILIVAPLRGLIRKLRTRFSAVLDSLDPDVPVGLTKQLDDMHTELAKLNSGPIPVKPVHDAPAAHK